MANPSLSTAITPTILAPDVLVSTQFAGVASGPLTTALTSESSTSQSPLTRVAPPESTHPVGTGRTDVRTTDPATSAGTRPDPDIWSVPIQLWEGTVKRVDVAAGVMSVTLSARLGNAVDHTADIDLQWVAPQDLDLVRPGAVFYWTIYKERKHGSIRNTQELRFRRFPTWSRAQLKRVRAEAARLRAKVRVPTGSGSASD